MSIYLYTDVSIQCPKDQHQTTYKEPVVIGGDSNTQYNCSHLSDFEFDPGATTVTCDLYADGVFLDSCTYIVLIVVYGKLFIYEPSCALQNLNKHINVSGEGCTYFSFIPGFDLEQYWYFYSKKKAHYVWKELILSLNSLYFWRYCKKITDNTEGKLCKMCFRSQGEPARSKI